MATSYSTFQDLTGGFKLSSANKPLDGRMYVNKDEDIAFIPYPYVGQIVYSKESGKTFIIKSLQKGYLDNATGNVYITKPTGITTYVKPNLIPKEYEELVGDQTYTNADPIINKIGGIEAGETFTDITFTDMWTKLLYPDVSPIITKVETNIEPGLYDKLVPLTALKIDVQVEKTTNELASLILLNGETEIETKDLTTVTLNDATDGSADGSTDGPIDPTPAIYTFDVAGPIDTDTTFVVKLVDDKGMETIEKLVYEFVMPVYVGVSDSAPLDETEIKASTKVITKSNAKQVVTCEDKYDYICYLASLGELVNVVEDNGFKTLNNYTKSEITIDGENYFVYVNNNKYSIEDYEIEYVFKGSN